MAHQSCLHHSYPPSHLHRNCYDLKNLSLYGWDPGGRLGLGVSGEGINVPIKTRMKNDTVGLGMVVPKRKSKAQKSEVLDAGKVRKTDKEDRRERQKLREMFYDKNNIEKYLSNY